MRVLLVYLAVWEPDLSFFIEQKSQEQTKPLLSWEIKYSGIVTFRLYSPINRCVIEKGTSFYGDVLPGRWAAWSREQPEQVSLTGDGGPNAGVQVGRERTGPLNTVPSKDYYFYSFFFFFKIFWCGPFLKSLLNFVTILFLLDVLKAGGIGVSAPWPGVGPTPLHFTARS